MTRTLTVLRQSFQSLVDKSYIDVGDVEAEQTKSASRAATDAVQELQRLTDNVVIVFVALRSQDILPPPHHIRISDTDLQTDWRHRNH